MSVYKSKGERYYRFDFQMRGHRFYGSTRRTARAAALETERAEKARAREWLNAPADTLDAIAGRWWLYRGQHRRDAVDVERRLERILFGLGETTRAAELSQADVAAYVARRRADRIEGACRADRQVAPATVNRELEIMRAAWNYAMRQGVRLPHIDWTAERLAEPEPRERVITEAEEDAVFRNLNPDYAPFYAAIIETGWRWSMAAALRWSDVRAESVEAPGKGGRIVRTPMTPYLRTLIDEQRGKHPEYVWTIPARDGRRGKVRGDRYPLNYDAARAAWQRACGLAGVAGVNIHQLRHTAATRLLRATGDLYLVQKLLGHTRITTTERYVHLLDSDLREGMERTRESLGNPRIGPRLVR